MDPISSISGIASGIQWRDMIDQIMQIESAPIDALNARIALAQQRSNAWSTFKSKVQAFYDAAQALADGSALGKLGASVSYAGSVAPLAASASDGAVAGHYQVVVERLAAAEKLGGETFASPTSALGLSGEFLVNGVRIGVDPADTLTTLARRINDAGAGVSASVVSTTAGRYRLVLTSSRTGAAGIDLTDASGVLGPGALGFLDGTVAARNLISNGALGDGFADDTTPVAALLGLQTPPSGTVTIGGVSMTLDLSRSLADIAADINTALGAGSSIQASVVDDVVDGATVKRLRITGTTSFADPSHVLESLGLVEGGRAAVAQSIQTGVLTTKVGPPTTATAATSLLDLGALEGETLTITGTRADGSALTLGTFTISSTLADAGHGLTLGDLVNALNDPTSGLRAAGHPTATASISADGRLVITDDVGGDSRLSVSIVANNELGGSLDLGPLSTATVGRARTITAGADAAMYVDGAYVQRASNTITDVIPGVTFDLLAASPGNVVDVNVQRDVDGAVAAIKSFVNAYNDLSNWVAAQMTPPPTGVAAPPLFGDSILRSMRAQLNTAMQRVLAPGVAGAYTRLADLGIEIDRNGRYTINESKLRDAVTADPSAVARLFGLSGTTTTGALAYVGAGAATTPGTYQVAITAAATRAAAVAGAFSTVAAGDTLTITDLGTGKRYVVNIAAGADIETVVSAINAELGRATSQQITLPAIYADAAATTPADETTPLVGSYTGAGSPLALADGDTLSITGTTSTGSSFSTSLQVTAASTLGDLRAAIQNQLGADATVTVDNGQLVVTSAKTGSSLLSLSITKAADASTPLGASTVATEGRPAAHITASVFTDAGGVQHIQLTDSDYGSANGFTVEQANGSELGFVGLVTATGTDVQGTIGGMPATGTGQLLTGAAGTAVEGLMVSYTGTTANPAAGSITFSRGVASAALLAADPLLGAGSGAIDAITQRLADGIAGYNTRIDDIQERLDRRREELIRRFTAMEQAIARSQSQMQWLSGQINALAANSKN
ncbi:MAG: flagellar filament capping protein FliD [Gemmatimonadetes bacterium]|nr:flagellar filament capping protein FliD [Gemmatimonadota bacterium]